MPRLTTAAEPQPATKVQFVLSVPLDLMNAMNFTSLVPHIDGLEGWPVRVRDEMAPDLLAELDFLCTYPKGGDEQGVMTMLADALWLYPESWKDVGSLLRFVRAMPLQVGDLVGDRVGVQGLVYYAALLQSWEEDWRPDPDLTPREEIERELVRSGTDPAPALALYDRPQELRERMARLIERFYEEHYKAELPNRLPCLERSAAAHRADVHKDPIALQKQLTGRTSACLGDLCAREYDRIYFAPSLDMGPYTSCSIHPNLHSLFYPCEPEFAGTGEGPDAAETQRLARVYKALGDEQRLKILGLLREREMYAQEIVERTGLHQSVISRHLSFMRVVGLLNVRRENNMKFYSLNPEIREQLNKTLDLFAPSAAR